MELPLIITASTSSCVLHGWHEGLRGFATVITARDPMILHEQLERMRPDVLLLDIAMLGLEGATGITDLRKRNPRTKIIALGEDVSDVTELILFKSGVRGFALITIEPQMLKRIVVAVQ